MDFESRCSADCLLRRFCMLDLAASTEARQGRRRAVQLRSFQASCFFVSHLCSSGYVLCSRSPPSFMTDGSLDPHFDATRQTLRRRLLPRHGWTLYASLVSHYFHSLRSSRSLRSCLPVPPTFLSVSSTSLDVESGLETFPLTSSPSQMQQVFSEDSSLGTSRTR